MRFAILLALLAAMLAAQTSDQRLVFSTYHGGDRNDDAVSAAVDGAGFLYVTGETESRDLKADPVGGKPLTSAVFKAYLTKYAPGGKEVVWRKLIGGTANTVTHAVALDRDGAVFVAGTTGARDLPLVNPVQDKQTGLNIAFLMKFSPSGELLFSTYFGGDRNEEGLALAVDSQNSVYLAGRASSSNLPVKNALQAQMAGGGQDGFIAKYTPDGARYTLAYATYFGGAAGTDNIHAIALGPDDSLYITGESMSPNLATPGAYIDRAQSYSSFLARLTPAGDAVLYFTYLGWSGGYTSARALAVDAQGRAYVGGYTSSKQLAVTPGAIQPAFGGGFRDAFLLRMNVEGTAAEYLTYLGGSTRGPTDPDETVTALQLDAHGHVYVAGETSSPDFPGRRVVQPAHGGVQDAYLMRLDLDKSEIIYSTFWGGQKKDAGLALALGPGENATLAGVSFSDDLPVANAVQSKLGSGNDAFVAQICDPWLSAYSEDSKTYEVSSGCRQPFAITDLTVSESWLKVTASGPNVPATLKVEMNADGLAPGEYRAVIRVSIAESFHRTLEIPVRMTVTE